MSCKNCDYNLTETAYYCQDCGAKVVKDRLTIRKIFQEFLNKVFGWDNTYLRTLRTIVVAPDKVAQDYISGIRKKFMPPFTFLLIGLTIATLVFNAFSDKYVEFSSGMLNESFYRLQFDSAKGKNASSGNLENESNQEAFEDFVEEQIEVQKKSQGMILKYFNLFAFLSIPMYTFIAFVVFGRKQYNYAEHLVINCYIQGFSMITSTLLFLMALFIHPYLFTSSVLIAIFYYSFTYKRLCDLTLARTLWKFIKFLIILTITFIVITVLFGILLVLIDIIFGLNLFN
ncbi:DUF3667 domain-containing protein [Aquimarina sp. MMG016]|uniref:DUF3667 domain-containing protein n=1 Tax=Aquimarina sp. MMG016 TaxID=2822690 RepID=UPI001B3A2D5B|nr:DUF3667 domain-containing protein [Aquimarina sp. MMG016]MBQ4819205.1 DUF3667 domain-containing protein [Aquimarina sp. MMG016]